MKKQTSGTSFVPASVSDKKQSKISELISYFLPESCRVNNMADFYMVTAVAFLCATFLFPPFILGALYCVNKSKKGGKK